MAIEIPTIVPKAILDALDLTADATRDEVLAAATALEDKPRVGLTTGELAQVDALRQALGVQSGATRDAVLTALRAKIPAPVADRSATFGLKGDEPVMSPGITRAFGLQPGAPIATVLGRIARLRVDHAIAERRVHRSQRPALLELAARDIATFAKFMHGSTEAIGYPTAEAELNALVDARVKTSEKLTFTAALTQVTREQPELAQEVRAERDSSFSVHEQRRHAAGEVLSEVFVTFVSAEEARRGTRSSGWNRNEWAETFEHFSAAHKDLARINAGEPS